MHESNNVALSITLAIAKPEDWSQCWPSLVDWFLIISYISYILILHTSHTHIYYIIHTWGLIATLTEPRGPTFPGRDSCQADYVDDIVVTYCGYILCIHIVADIGWYCVHILWLILVDIVFTYCGWYWLILCSHIVAIIGWHCGYILWLILC